MLLAFLTTQPALAESFRHETWDTLLKRHVVSVSDGKVTAVDYRGMARDRDHRTKYLRSLSSVERRQFDRWPADEQLAFLINAYNAWTVELILTAWPDLESIKDLGNLFRSPWNRPFIPLLGKTRTLDDIEHDLIRGSGRYDDPRVHFAVNCASIGCPALRAEAYDGGRLDRQLEEQTLLFLADRSRNRVENGTVKLSPVFKWYREDFETGWRDLDSLEQFLARYADALELPARMAQQAKAGNFDIEYLDYDWRLNEIRR